VLFASHFKKLAPGTKFPKKIAECQKIISAQKRKYYRISLLCSKKKKYKNK
jgi:hypothetical protein